MKLAPPSWRALVPRPDAPPPGPFRRPFWNSPLRGPWLTSILGSLLLAALVVITVTGFLSHAAYEPNLPGNAIVDRTRDLPLTFGWPTAPSWLYAFTQGAHVNIGLVAIPLLVAKLWSVIPRLYAWPPIASPAQAVERVMVGLLVGSAIFEFATGVANFQNWYPFKFNFIVAHYYGAVVFVAALTAHVVLKLPIMVRAYRTQGVLRPLRDDLAHTSAERGAESELVPPAPAPATLTRRGLLGFVGTGSAALLVANVGQSIGGPLRPVAFLAPRRSGFGPGPNDFAVNKTAASAGVKPAQMGDGYRLVLAGGRAEVPISRTDLLKLPQHTEDLPIACVEGWSTTQSWTGVRLADLARLAGLDGPEQVLVESLQPAGVLRRASLSRDQVADERSLLALRVNGADLSPDHGYPARIIVPALPGVHNTKWVARMTFGASA